MAWKWLFGICGTKWLFPHSLQQQLHHFTKDNVYIMCTWWLQWFRCLVRTEQALRVPSGCANPHLFLCKQGLQLSDFSKIGKQRRKKRCSKMTETNRSLFKWAFSAPRSCPSPALLQYDKKKRSVMQELWKARQKQSEMNSLNITVIER